MNKFYGDWESVADLAKDFHEDISIFNGVNILFAAYTYEDYSGSAFVLYEYEGNLYEVNADHCSCYGLEEDGWSPEETSKEAILHRLDNGSSYGIFHAHKKEIREALQGYNTGAYVFKFYDPSLAEKITQTGQEILQKFVDSDTVIDNYIEEVAALKKELGFAYQRLSDREEYIKEQKKKIDEIYELANQITKIVKS